MLQLRKTCKNESRQFSPNGKHFVSRNTRGSMARCSLSMKASKWSANTWTKGPARMMRQAAQKERGKGSSFCLRFAPRCGVSPRILTGCRDPVADKDGMKEAAVVKALELSVDGKVQVQVTNQAVCTQQQWHQAETGSRPGLGCPPSARALPRI